MRGLHTAAAVLLLAWGLGCSCSGDKEKSKDITGEGGAKDVAKEQKGEIQPPAEVSPEETTDLPLRDQPAPDLPTPGWPKRLTILHTNDLHSHLYGFGPEKDFTPGTTKDDDTVGGVARIATVIKKEKEAAQGDVLVLDAGDFTMGSAFSLLTATEGVELKIMDALGVQATTLGNHEFDWGPAGAAAIVAAGKKGEKKDAAIRILAGNLETSADSPADDDFEGVLAQKLVEEEIVLETPGGLKVGLFGLMGSKAKDDAPFMTPMDISDLEDAAKEHTKSLRGQGVHLVVALSHSGVIKGGAKAEDEKLAEAVPGLDVIVSGHTHAPLKEKEGDADTIVVQAGSYGQFVGRLVVDVFEDHVDFVSFDLLPVDDTVEGEAGIQAMVDGFRAKLDEKLQALGLEYDSVLAATAFDIPTLELAESPLGNLVTDAIVAVANKVPGMDPPVTAAFEANGVIRDSVLKGKTGQIWLADAFRVLPLGMGPDKVPGYPIVTFFVTAKDLKSACEAAVAIPMMMGDSYFLQFAGLKFTYDAGGGLFNAVKEIRLREGDGYSDTPLDTGEENKTLYRVAVNSYVAAMMYVLEAKSGGLLSVTPRDKDGNPIADMSTTVLDADPATDGLQELKLWQTLVKYFSALPDADGDKIPDVPPQYEKAEGRMLKL